MKCNHCEKEIQEGSKFCPYCGQKVEQVIKCPNCGNSIRPGDIFCMCCGKKVGSVEIDSHMQDNCSEIQKTAPKEESNNSSKPLNAKVRSKMPLYVGIIACVAIVLAGIFYYLRSSGSNANNPRIEIENIQYKGSYELKNWSYGPGWKNYEILSLDIAWPVSINGIEPTQLQSRILQRIRNLGEYDKLEILGTSNIFVVLKDLNDKKLDFTPEYDEPEPIWIREVDAKVTVLASTKKYITFEYTISRQEYEYSGDGNHGYITYDIEKSECVEDRLINKNSITEIAKYLLRNDEYYNLHPEEYPLEPDDFDKHYNTLDIGLSEKGIICEMGNGLFYANEECSLDQLREYVSEECVELLTDNEHCDYVVKDIGNIITY